jgi:hypothetical protein
VASVGFR